MAKRRSLNQTAESIGAGLGHLQNKYDEWMKQRDVIASELRDYVSSAQKMLDNLGHTADVAVAQAKGIAAVAVKAGKRVISAEHKAKISLAAKARWAKRKAKKKTRNVSPEVRAKLARLTKERWAKAKKAGKTKLG